MKKVLLAIPVLVIMVLSSINLASCKKDDDNTTNDPAIVGTWELRGNYAKDVIVNNGNPPVIFNQHSNTYLPDQATVVAFYADYTYKTRENFRATTNTDSSKYAIINNEKIVLNIDAVTDTFNFKVDNNILSIYWYTHVQDSIYSDSAVYARR